MAKAEPITEQQAQAIGVDAYLYFYPLVTMDLTRKQLTNVETGKGFALAEVNRKNADSGKPALNARIGIETGPVVVDASGELYGDAPNTAARVQALADPGTVIVTARVQRQIAGLFVAEERGSHDLKGVPEPVRLFQVVRPSGGGRRAGQRHHSRQFANRGRCRRRQDD